MGKRGENSNNNKNSFAFEWVGAKKDKGWKLLEGAGKKKRKGGEEPEIIGQGDSFYLHYPDLCGRTHWVCFFVERDRHREREKPTVNEFSEIPNFPNLRPHFPHFFDVARSMHTHTRYPHTHIHTYTQMHQ